MESSKIRRSMRVYTGREGIPVLMYVVDETLVYVTDAAIGAGDGEKQ